VGFISLIALTLGGGWILRAIAAILGVHHQINTQHLPARGLSSCLA
jgi:hypothetical protein